MENTSVWELVGIALGSGFIVKLLDIFYEEVRKRNDRSKSAKRFVDEHLDPLLKAGDELAGKLHALAKDDFRRLKTLPDVPLVENLEILSLMYLFARFWANIEMLKIEGLSIAIAQDERGGKLLQFINCLESRRVRLIDRTSQRAIGETCLLREDSRLRVLPFTDFVILATEECASAKWQLPLVNILLRGWHTHNKQSLLTYGTILHSMLDTLDPKNEVTKNRPPLANKLTKRTKDDLRQRVFRVYLSFVANSDKYTTVNAKRRKGICSKCR